MNNIYKIHTWLLVLCSQIPYFGQCRHAFYIPLSIGQNNAETG